MNDAPESLCGDVGCHCRLVFTETLVPWRSRAKAAEARVACPGSDCGKCTACLDYQNHLLEARVAELESKLATYEGTNLIAQVAGIMPGKAQAAVIDALKATLDISQARVAELEAQAAESLERVRSASINESSDEDCPLCFGEGGAYDPCRECGKSAHEGPDR